MQIYFLCLKINYLTNSFWFAVKDSEFKVLEGEYKNLDGVS